MRSKDPVSLAALPQYAVTADQACSGGAQLFTFPSRPAARAPRTGGHGPGKCLSLSDHAVLAAWIGDPGHGYDRLHIEREEGGGAAGASFALVYRPGLAWSVWGIARQDGAVEVWHCGTGRTVGRYGTMGAALAALPHASQSRRA